MTNQQKPAPLAGGFDTDGYSWEINTGAISGRMIAMVKTPAGTTVAIAARRPETLGDFVVRVMGDIQSGALLE